MNIANEISRWVEKKPVVLIRFDEGLSNFLNESRQGFEHLTIARSHLVFGDFKLPTLCLLETQEQNKTKCYLGTAKVKKAVSTFDSRLTIKKLRLIKPSALKAIGQKLSNNRFRNLFNRKISDEVLFSALTPKLSVQLIDMLAKDQRNQSAMETAAKQLPQLVRTPNINWAQENAIRSAMSAFGLHANQIPTDVAVKTNAASEVSSIGSYLYEDNVIRKDACQLPGFDAIEQDITGRAVFEKRDERLVIYTANKLPLEKMFGVDLIYVNEISGNIVMIQYKMLEKARSESGNKDWVFRPDKQLKNEIKRMKFPDFKTKISDYRLNSNPFFFKFVKRSVEQDSCQSFVISLHHLNQILESPVAAGPRGGIRLSYNALKGIYLREADIVGLIRSGYIGTHRAETQILSAVISEASRGNKALVLAWEGKMRKMR